MGIDFVRFNPALARGLDYYTGTTLEVFLKNREIVNSAILAGGRFDNMVGDFCGGEEIPAVGFSFGLERLAMVLAGQNSNLPSTTVQVYLVPTEGADVGDILASAHKLRQQGLNVDSQILPLSNRQRKRIVGNVADAGIPYIGFVSPQGVEAGTVGVKNLSTRDQNDVPVGEVAKYIASENCKDLVSPP